jgi:serine/threonine protein kinase
VVQDDDGEPTVEATPSMLFDDDGNGGGNGGGKVVAAQQPTEVFVQQRRHPLLVSDPRGLGDYRIECRLKVGDGADGVFVGYCRPGTLTAARLDPLRPLVIKTLRPGADARGQEWFLREVRNGQRVKGARVAPVLDVGSVGDGEHAGLRYFVQEFVPGRPLSEFKHRPLDQERVLPVAVQLLEALEAIHRAGVVHRDVKPENVVLSPGGAVVVDFGISHHADDASLTTVGLVRGTRTTISPEQLRGSAGPASDVFSWAVTIAWIATGHHPFLTQRQVVDLTTEEVRREVTTGTPRLDGVPEPLAGQLRRSLDPDPRRRPAIEQMLGPLREALADRLAGVEPTSVFFSGVSDPLPVHDDPAPLFPWLPRSAGLRRRLRRATRTARREIVGSRLVFGLAIIGAAVSGTLTGVVVHVLLTTVAR